MGQNSEKKYQECLIKYEVCIPLKTIFQCKRDDPRISFGIKI